MLRTGRHKDYHFLQTTKDGYDFNRFVLNFSEFLIGKAVGILSFDADSMNPTKEEFERGWTYDEQEVAYFYPLDENELRENIFANCYDEWYLFDRKSELKSNHIFVTYSGFRLISSIKSDLMNATQIRFWNQIKMNNPVSFIINGDNFIYGTKNKADFDIIKESWS